MDTYVYSHRQHYITIPQQYHLDIQYTAGFEHSITDMFYFSSAGYFNIESLTFIIVIIIGNAIGCTLIPLYNKYMEDPEKEKTEST